MLKLTSKNKVFPNFFSMFTKKTSAEKSVRSIPAVENALHAQIRGEKTHGDKLKKVPGLHRARYFLARRKNLKKLHAKKARADAKSAAVWKKIQREAAEIAAAIKHDQEIQDGFLTKKEMRDFKVMRRGKKGKK